MYIQFCALTRDNQPRRFSFRVEALEQGLDVINQLVSSGESLIEIYLRDNKSLLRLPVEGFDGELCSEPMSRLQTEWERVLA